MLSLLYVSGLSHPVLTLRSEPIVGRVLRIDGSSETTVRPDQDDAYLVVIWGMFSSSQAPAGSDTFQCWKQAHVHHYKKQGSWRCVGDVGEIFFTIEILITKAWGGSGLRGTLSGLVRKGKPYIRMTENPCT
jgi:hypothetical protein